MRQRSIYIGEVGRVKFKGKTWILGTAPLMKLGLRGQVMTPEKGKVGAIVISDHLPVYGPMCTEAIIHETLHVAFPKAKEAAIRKGANLVARVLRKYEAAKSRVD